MINTRCNLLDVSAQATNVSGLCQDLCHLPVTRLSVYGGFEC